MLLRACLCVVLMIVAAAGVFAAEKKPFGPNEISKIKRVGDLALSPDGKWVAYLVTETMMARNKRRSHIYVVATAGGDPRVLTVGAKGDGHPVWTPDGRSLGFVSSRDKGSQVYLMPFDQGGEPRKLTNFPLGIDEFAFTPDGKGLVFAARTYLSCKENLLCIKKQDAALRADPVSAVVHERLLYRHWDTYEDGKVQHLFYQPLGRKQEPEEPRDITPELGWDALSFWLLSAGREFDVTPDSEYVYFAGTQEDEQATTYNHDIYRASIKDGKVEKITDNPASDMLPRVSPDGRYLAWRGSTRVGYESDRYQLMLRELDSGKERSLTPDTDLSVGNVTWSPDSKKIYFEAEEKAHINLYEVDLQGRSVTPVVGPERSGPGYHLMVQVDPKRKFFVYLYRTIDMLYEIYRCRIDGSRPEALTAVNAEVYATYHIPTAEEVWFNGAEGAKVHGFVVKPIDYDPDKRYPLMVRVHGGPQQMFGYAFRYEFAVFSSAGYFVFFCNPRGSTGYGQEFSDGVRGDWGGKPVDDLKAGVAHVLEKYPAIDPARVGAWGGSYGGFIVNWLQGHNQDRMFAALVAHAGSAGRWAAWGTTEELWFPEWEMHGPPWENPELNDKLSPIRYAADFATPQLITHGDQDYRVHVSGGEAMFSALQRRGVPSKFIRFPDENHWVMKPHNQRFWYRSILEWFDQWLKTI